MLELGKPSKKKKVMKDCKRDILSLGEKAYFLRFL